MHVRPASTFADIERNSEHKSFRSSLSLSDDNQTLMKAAAFSLAQNVCTDESNISRFGSPTHLSRAIVQPNLQDDACSFDSSRRRAAKRPLYSAEEVSCILTAARGSFSVVPRMEKCVALQDELSQSEYLYRSKREAVDSSLRELKYKLQVLEQQVCSEKKQLRHD